MSRPSTDFDLDLDHEGDSYHVDITTPNPSVCDFEEDDDYSFDALGSATHYMVFDDCDDDECECVSMSDITRVRFAWKEMGITPYHITEMEATQMRESITVVCSSRWTQGYVYRAVESILDKSV
jgi:hypothetical protein